MAGQRLKLALALLTSSLLFSCSTPSATKPASDKAQVKPTPGYTVDQPNPERQADALIPPETVRSEGVRIEYGAKTLTVGNAQGRYLLSCNISDDSCITPIPGKNYLLFTKATK